MKKGFTLIELLIVIAILGVLAVVVLLALNPVQQLARTRDAGRSSAVTQLGHAIESYATVRNGAYPVVGGAGTCATATWITTCLQVSGEIQSVPVNTYATTGGAGAVCEQNYCYIASAVGPTQTASIYARAEATSNTSQCTAGQTGYFVFSTAAGRGGLWCGAAAPGAAISGTDAGWR